jgi:hypothetical protein
MRDLFIVMGLVLRYYVLCMLRYSTHYCMSTLQAIYSCVFLLIVNILNKLSINLLASCFSSDHLF